MFNPGTKVTWSSQAGGYEKTKTGKVIVFIPKNMPIWKLIPGLDRKRVKGQMVSQSDRYLVEVVRGGKSALFDYYTPFEGWVREAANESTTNK